MQDQRGKKQNKIKKMARRAWLKKDIFYQ